MRVSATLLESYRRMMDADDELQDRIEQELIAKIKGDFVWTPEMRLGAAYHAILERPQRSLLGGYEEDGFRFDAEAVDAMLVNIPPGGLFEVKQTREILVPGVGPVTLVAKTDHLYGAHLSEFKTTLSTFDSDKYCASYQWRMMALLFEPEILTYRVACLSEDKKTGTIGLRSIETLNVFTYRNLEADVRRLVRELCCYVDRLGLADYLRIQYPPRREKTVVLEGMQPR